MTVRPHPITVLEADLCRTKVSRSFWRIATLIVGLCTVFLGLGLGAAVSLGLEQAEDLAAYRDRCVDEVTATKLLETAARINQINQMCIDTHQKHLSILHEALPGIFVDQDRITTLGLFNEGGESERERKRRKGTGKTVPKVSRGKGGGQFLPRQSPK